MTRWTSLAGRALAASIVAPLIVAALTLAAFVGGGVGAAYGQAFTGLAPADPVPAAAELRPGLGMKYLIQKFDSLREIEDMATWSKPSEGAPLPMLDYNVGRGAVLSNHNEDLVGAFIDGFGEDLLERRVELRPAVAAAGAEHVPGQAAGMQTHQRHIGVA